MVKVTTDFSGGETIATTKTRLEAILDYWLGTSSTSGVSTWGDLRTLLNSVAPSVVTIADGELASVFRPKINSLNDPDGIISSTLFGSSEQGVWYDPSDLSTLFQDTAGTTPVTTAGQTVGLMLDKSGNDLDATQATAAARPTYQTDGTYHWLSFDGVDDFMVTPTITPSIDKAQVFSGQHCNNNTGFQIVAELSTSSDSNSGSFRLERNTTSHGYQIGNVAARILRRTVDSAPTTDVVNINFDYASGGSVDSRLNGVQSEWTTVVLNTLPAINFGNYPMYIGARAGLNSFFNGNIYSLVTRFGANLEASTIETTEKYVAGKTGVDL